MSDENVDGANADPKTVRPGDRVRANQHAAAKVDMTPNDLAKIGWPHGFLVVDTYVLEERDILVLDPCCLHMVNPATNAFLCKGHPAEHFKKIEPIPGEDEPARRPADRFLRFQTPLGELLNLEYMEKQENPELTLEAFGIKGFGLSGEQVRQLGDWLKEKGVL